MQNVVSDARYPRLLRVACLLESGQSRAARRELGRIALGDPRSSPADLKASIFAKALAHRRVAGHTHDLHNLYLMKLELPQIDLFNLMARKMPLVSLSARISNLLLARLISGLGDEAVLIDIGIGTGRQEVELLRLLAAQGRLPRRLRIVGIEPASECLVQAARAIEEEAARLGIAVIFEPLARCIESLTRADWASLRRYAGRSVLNEAFALHHVGGSGSGKDDVLRELRALEPAGFVLCEPHSDHASPSLATRFRSAWKHFGLVFDVIDRLELSADEKAALKLRFFAREIEDILGEEEDARTERHETAEMWHGRLARAGFRPEPVNSEVMDIEHPFVRVARHPGYISLDLGDEAIVSTVLAKAA